MELEHQGIRNLQGNSGILLINKLYDLIVSKTLATLVVFDNMEGFENIQMYLPLNRNVDNMAILLTSVNEVTLPLGHGEIGTFQVDLLEDDEAKELVASTLNHSTDYTENEISFLVSESGRVPIILSIMAGTIAFAGSAYSITKFLHEIEAEKQSRHSKNPSTQENLNFKYQEIMYACVKIAIRKLKESPNKYASIALKFFEGCGYFNNICPFDFILKKVPAIIQDSERILEESPSPLEPKQMLKRAIKLLSKFSLVNYEADNDSSVEIHRLVKNIVGLIQQDEQRERDILDELIGCGDFSEYFDVWNAEMYLFFGHIR
ncbi:uncharacterized protein LOC118438878 [Folsomia candida]|nr:uncharacterized protein LOC118438878 [Folsomia candida]XP_035715587.1 uncharacterized protein LOC118438878 [Folsomia candida]